MFQNFFYENIEINELEHHGIKGQKWGVRRYQNSDGTYTNEGRKRYRILNANPRHTGKDDPVKKAREDRKKAYQNRRLLTDEELRARVARLSLEKQFRDLSRKDLHPGLEIAADILSVAGPQAMKTMTSGAILYSAKAGMTRKFDWNEAADYIAPKPKKK